MKELPFDDEEQVNSFLKELKHQHRMECHCMEKKRRHELLNFDTVKNRIIAIGSIAFALSCIGGIAGWMYVQAKALDEDHIKKVASFVCEEKIRPICKVVTETNYILREIADTTAIVDAMRKMKADSIALSLQCDRK